MKMSVCLAATKAKLAAAGVILLTSGFAANALTYETSGSPTLFSLGDTIGSSYDQLQIQGATGTLISNTDVVLNTLTFTAGINALVPATYNGLYSFTETITINGLGGPSATITVPFNLSISYSDTLTILGGTSVSIPVGSNIWNFVVNPLTIGPNSGGPITEALMAHVTDPPAATPLPAAFFLFGSGLGAIELLRRRKKGRATTASAQS